MAEKTPISPNQIKLITPWFELLFVVLAVWIGLTSKSLLLLAQAILLLPRLTGSLQLLGSKLKIKANQENLIWLTLSSLFIGYLLSLEFLELNSPLANPDIGAMLTLSGLALVSQLFFVMGVRRKPLKMMFFREHLTWILIFAVATTIYFSNYQKLDIYFSLSFSFYFLTRVALEIWNDLNQKPEPTKRHKTTDLDQEIADKLLEIAEVKKLYDFKILEIDGQETVIGSLILSNSATQEQIHTAKTQAREILEKHDFEDSVIETKYLIELDSDKNLTEK